MLGTLLGGVPVATMGAISGQELILSSQNPSFLANLINTPIILQQTFVTQVQCHTPGAECVQ